MEEKGVWEQDTPRPPIQAMTDSENRSEALPEDEASAPLLVVTTASSAAALLEAALAPLGRRLVTTLQASKPLEARQEGDFACVLLDVRQGWEEGLALAHHLRSQEPTRRTPLLFLAMDAREETQVLRAYALGSADCFFEPLSPDLLRAKVGLLLQQQQREQALRTALERAEQAKVPERESEHPLRNLLGTESSEGALETVLQQLPAGVYILEAPSGRVLHANRRAEEILGHPLLRAQNVADYGRYSALHPDGRRYAPEEYPTSRVLATGEPVMGEEMLYQRPDGTVRGLHVNAAPVRDEQGRMMAVVMGFMDITARRQAETQQGFLATVSEVLASSLDYEATLAQLVQQAVPTLGDGCLVDLLETDGTIRRVAVAYVEPGLAETAWEVARRYPIRLDAPFGPGAVIRTGRTELRAVVEPDRFTHYTSDPEHLALLNGLQLGSSMVVPLHARGRTLGAITFNYTVASGQHYGEEERLLAEDVARRTALAVDNARLFHEAQLAIRARDEFLSVASHELKTPLTPLQLKLAALERDLRRRGIASEQDAQFLRHLEMTQRQVRKMAALVGELLDVSRLSQGRLSLDLAETDLGEVLREVVAQFTPEAARVGSELRVEADTQLLGRWDRLRLEQVVGNLLSNAIRYGPGRPIHTRVERQGNQALLTVRDEGIGIAPEAQERIFGRFERAVSERHYGGLGLGLYITRRIVEALGGTIRVRSQQGEGATFTVELPVAGPPTVSTGRAPSGE
jgi:PAS domain S-box-containing protein